MLLFTRNYTVVHLTGPLAERLDIVETQLGIFNLRMVEMDLRFQLLEASSYNGSLLWKITNYSKRKADALAGKTLSLYSQPFYTHRHGYKMCGRVYLNGDGMGKEFVYVIKRKYPFFVRKMYPFVFLQ